MNDELTAELGRIAPVKRDEPMSRHVTFGVGGPADLFMTVRSEDELREAFVTAKRHGVPVYIFGSGSNVLVGDGGIRGLVIDNQHAAIGEPWENGVGPRVGAGSGVSFATLARRLATAGYGGVEWACGIPGSLGGAVVSNAGAYGHSLRDVLISARLTDAEGKISELSADQLELGYRKSALASGTIGESAVLSVEVRLKTVEAAALKEMIRRYDEQRKSAQPTGQNCGSVFKNPPDRAAWEYVDAAGLRGHRIGNAQFSELHSNFILNLGGATAKDITSLIELAQAKIREQAGVEMTPEVAFVGEFA
ncbi:MAG TPA: UDP-N-acetylmuramate dehydrogenase [Dehalococcoidia bacterium]